MKTRTLALALLTTLPLLGCQATLPPGERIGLDLEPGTVHSLATVSESPDDYADQTLLVEATVSAVCVRKGCWMQVEDEGRIAMVRWEDGCGGQFAFPQSAVGKRILIQGSFYATEISEEDAEHLEQESSADIEIARQGYELNASAVLIPEA